MEWSVKELAVRAKEASHILGAAATSQKDAALGAIACKLSERHEAILEANQLDIVHARKDGLSESLIDRLSLQGRLEGVIDDLCRVMQLPDPVGEEFDPQELSSGLQVVKWRTSIGVLGVIYESRPNVTVDVSGLSIKSGNCAILRGGSETLNTNLVLVAAIQSGLSSVGLPPEAVQLIPAVDRTHVEELLRLYDYIDLIIPRGGAALHRFCRETSAIPVITGGVGVCHLFVDDSADLERSLPLIVNAKTQRPTVCNALDTLLVHRAVAHYFIPEVVKVLCACKVSFRCDPKALSFIVNPDHLSCGLAKAEDWDSEWCSLVLGIKVVEGLEEAVSHITAHSTGHSDGILTADESHATEFLKRVDSAAVYVNASTRFTDGGQLGLGAEVAISTQKIHARGPMGLRELTSYKWVIRGDYAVRQ